MEPDDPDQWMEQLTGKGAEAHPRTAKLRAAIQRMEEKSPVGEPPPVSALLFRLRREGVLEKSNVFWRHPALMAMAASVAVVTITLSMWHTTDESALDESSIVRSLPTQYRYETADPEATAKALVKDLAAQGISARVEREDGEVAVMFTLPDAPSAGVGKLLLPYGIKEVKGKQRVVVVVRRQQRQP